MEGQALRQKAVSKSLHCPSCTLSPDLSCVYRVNSQLADSRCNTGSWIPTAIRFYQDFARLRVLQRPLVSPLATTRLPVKHVLAEDEGSRRQTSGTSQDSAKENARCPSLSACCRYLHAWYERVPAAARLTSEYCKSQRSVRLSNRRMSPIMRRDAVPGKEVCP